MKANIGPKTWGTNTNPNTARQLARSAKSSSTPRARMSLVSCPVLAVKMWKHSTIESIRMDKATAEEDLAVADFAHSPNAEIEKTVRLDRLSLSVVTSRLQREFMRLIPKRRRCKNFSSASLLLQHRDKGRGRRRGSVVVPAVVGK